MSTISDLVARRLGLHPWQMIAERYSEIRPAKLKRVIVSVDDAERHVWMQGVMGLKHGERVGQRVSDCFGVSVSLNERIIDHIRPHPERAPYLPWVTHAVQNPLEVWKSFREGTSGHLESRLYYLYAAKVSTLHSIAVIAAESDRVAFNLIPFYPKDAKKFRIGELVYVGYDLPFGRCPHGCCDRVS